MPAHADFVRKMPWFDEVIIDERASSWRFGKWHALAKEIRQFNPQRVYDLQGKFRQSVLYTLLGGPMGPEWSGAAPLAKYKRVWPPKPDMHFTDFVAAQLRLAGVPDQHPSDLKWLNAPIANYQVPRDYVLLIPGCAPGREYKRWPPRRYADLALLLREKGVDCIAIGTKQDIHSIMAIRQAAPHVLDYTGRTSLLQLAGLARQAVAVVGNDTGPTHLTAAIGAPTLALMSDKVNPKWSAPAGPKARWLQGTPLGTLKVDEVFVALMALAAS